MAYATVEQLQAYLGTEPPAGVARLLERASELLDYAALGRIDLTKERHIAAAQKAACAQVEYWIEQGEEVAKGATPQSVSIGNLSLDYTGRDGSGGGIPQLAPRARQALFLAGLLYRGVGMGGTIPDAEAMP
jgi:hypothetical protein